MKRREFIILSGVGAASASLLSACRHPEEKLIPALIPDDEYVPGIDYWKASTCGMCPAGCGIVVRTREHQANKIEGNPLHPVNRGALCARGQAGLQVLYNPDRIKGPMKRIGERGEGKWEEISWDEAIKTLADKLREIKNGGQGRKIVFVTSDLAGLTGFAGRWLQAVSDASLVGDTRSDELSTSDYADSYGRHVVPIFDVANATYLLSFGARFLEAWHSPVRYSLAYGQFRGAVGKPRGRFVQVEPRMSLTGANADEWLPAAPGTEGVLALAIAQVIFRENLVKDASTPKFLSEPLDSYAPEKTAELTGITADRVLRIAREFASSSRPLAMGGAATPSALVNRVKTVDGQLTRAANGIAINFLNIIVSNLNKPGGVLLPRDDAFDLLEDAQPDGLLGWNDSFAPEMITNETQAILVHHVNPVHSHPGCADRVKQLRFIASFSSFVDETSALADLLLPDHTYLESWNVIATHADSSKAAVTITRPVIKPEFNTRQATDVLLAVVRELAADASESPTGNSRKLSIDSAQHAVINVATRLQKLPGSIAADSTDGFLTLLSERGVWTGELSGHRYAVERDAPRIEMADFQSGAGDSDVYRLSLIAYRHAALGNGEQANLPWVQELPDAMTSVIWGSWVEINPKTAASLGIEDGDLVEVSTEHGAVRVPAVIYPAIRPDVIAMPFGQGHTAYGRYAQNRGVNPASLSPGLQGTVRAKVTKLAGRAKLIRFGTDLWQELEKKR
jgi:anaerobic selenocysteine-containing dehydrogenase